MKERLFIFGAMVFFLILMIGLNALSYVQKVKEPDSEFTPIRSTYHPGATGLQAYYTLLTETGRPAGRLQRPPSELRSELQNAPTTFIIVGPLRREYSEHDRDQLMEWVALGGKLVVIDREPQEHVLSTVGYWSATASPNIVPELLTTDPADRQKMTADTPAARPDVPSLITASVNSVQPSRFASSIDLRRATDAGIGVPTKVHPDPVAEDHEDEDGYDQYGDVSEESTFEEYSGDPESQNDEPYDFYSGGLTPRIRSGDGNDEEASETSAPPPPAYQEPTGATPADEDEEEPYRAPIVHISERNRNLLVELPYGAGKIFILGDPFIVSNGGISIADNAQLAINLAGSGGGLAVFDEYHHGYGAGSNRIFEYFQGTPVVAILTQLFLLGALVLVSRSRRFARPIPAPEPDRLTKLEYVGAMAELQLRTKAFDLAMENIYGDFRRRISRSFGVDNTTTSRRELASLIAERTGGEAEKIDSLMERCESIAHGERTDRREVIRLASDLRSLEDFLRLTRQGRRRI